MSIIYLDNHATTQVDPRVLEEMMPYFTEEYGNSSSSHPYGWRAIEAVEEARERVARLVGANPHDIVFTSGATEANNTVIKGIKVDRIITQVTEHSSVIEPCRAMSHNPIIGVDKYGIIDETSLIEAAFDNRDDVLVSIMAANNEIGTIQNLGKLGRAFENSGCITFHSDMAQVLGRIPIDVKELKLDFASFSAHKIYGPKGVGALYVNTECCRRPTALIHGGQHEGALRSGTLNVPGIVGFGKACDIVYNEKYNDVMIIRVLRDRLESALKKAVSVEVYGHPTMKLPGNLSIYLPCLNVARFMSLLEEHVAFSTGSACSGFSNKSHVLEAIGTPPEKMKSTFRFGIGRFNSKKEIDLAAEHIIHALNKVNSGG
jgi:cysteine desulfurase